MDLIQPLNLYLKLKIILRNIEGSRRIFTLQNYDSLYVTVASGGFDLRSGRNLGKKRNGATQLLQYIAATENNGFAQLYAYDPKNTSHKTNDEDMYLNMEYEMHMGTKLDYLFFQSSLLLQASEIQLLKNQCEQERT